MHTHTPGPRAHSFQAQDFDQYETVNVAVDMLSPMVRATDYDPALWNLTGQLYTSAAAATVRSSL